MNDGKLVAEVFVRHRSRRGPFQSRRFPGVFARAFAFEQAPEKVDQKNQLSRRRRKRRDGYENMKRIQRAQEFIAG